MVVLKSEILLHDDYVTRVITTLIPRGAAGNDMGRGIKQEEVPVAPRSMFDRVVTLNTANTVNKFRRDIKMHKFRNVPRGGMVINFR